MARDVAQRQLDQAGFRISNLGQPVDRNDATKTDNTTVPLVASGSGSPGSSLLAAPVDHVHPAPIGGSGGALLEREDQSEQASSGAPAVIWEALIDFSKLPGTRTICALKALARAQNGTGKLELKLGGTVGHPDGETVIEAEITSNASSIVAAEAEVDKPSGVALVKVLACTPSDDVTVWVRAKAFSFGSV